MNQAREDGLLPVEATALVGLLPVIVVDARHVLAVNQLIVAGDGKESVSLEGIHTISVVAQESAQGGVLLDATKLI